ncbi:MAG: 3-oxoadipate enol-lactonase [Hyphomicrobiaceae bacterium]|jgi:3-oxoadipate enol-lactonase
MSQFGVAGGAATFPAMPYADAESAKIYYEVEGTGPPVTFLMGFGAPMKWWFPQVPFFSRDHQVVRLDPRGIGGSEETAEKTITMSLLADDVACVLDDAGISSSHIVGLSYGGMVAQELALRHPDRVDRLVLASTNAGGATAVQPDPELISTLLTTLMLDQPEDSDVLLDAIGPTLFPKSYLDEHRAEVLELIQGTGFDPAGAALLARQMEAVMGHDILERLGNVSRPTLCLTGTEDVLVPAGNAAILAARIPGAQLAQVDEAGHCAHIQLPDAWNQVVHSFLTASR